MDLNLIAKEIRVLLQAYRNKYQITFDEDTHTYTMLDNNGILRNDYPSVSKVITYFHDEFDAKGKSFQMCNGDLKQQKQLLLEWKRKGDYATNMGSRVHYELEKYLIGLYGDFKDVRTPIFECDEVQVSTGDKMILGGQEFIKTMHNRNAVLLDTEIVLGSPDVGYVGQPDKVWLYDNNGELCFICTDWKSNNPKNFKVQPYTDKMYEPFNELSSTALSHYYIQLSCYCKLIIDMLRGTKYENIKLIGCIIVLLKKEGVYEEYRVPKKVYNKILEMDIKEYMNKKRES